MVGVGCATPILSLCVQLLRLWTSILDPPNPDVVVLVGIVASCIAHSHMLPMPSPCFSATSHLLLAQN